MEMRKEVNADFFKSWSPQMAYVLGFFCADGYLQMGSQGGGYVCFSSTDEEIILKIRTMLSSTHAVGRRDRRKKNPRWNIEYVLQVGNKKLYKDLEYLGLTRRKSLTLAFPDVPEACLGDFVRGYFDGAGCVHLGHYWRKDRGEWKWQFSTNFTSGSKGFLTELFRRLTPYVFGGHIASKTGGYELVFSHWDSIALFNLMYNNASADVFLERKHSTFRRAFEILGIDR